MAGFDDLLDSGSSKEPPLAYPTWPLKVRGGIVEEYIIPDNDKEEILGQLYPFDPVPSLEDEVFDLHEGRIFKVREFRVTREHGMNWLVSPYYPNSGGTVIDWMPPEFAEEQEMSNHQFKPDALPRSASLRVPVSFVLIHKREEKCRNRR